MTPERGNHIQSVRQMAETMLAEIDEKLRTCDDPKERESITMSRAEWTGALWYIQEYRCPHPDRDTTIMSGYIYYGPCAVCGKDACAEKLTRPEGGGRR